LLAFSTPTHTGFVFLAIGRCLSRRSLHFWVSSSRLGLAFPRSLHLGHVLVATVVVGEEIVQSVHSPLLVSHLACDVGDLRGERESVVHPVAVLLIIGGRRRLLKRPMPTE
jgi:hypothetical protein